MLTKNSYQVYKTVVTYRISFLCFLSLVAKGALLKTREQLILLEHCRMSWVFRFTVWGYFTLYFFCDRNSLRSEHCCHDQIVFARVTCKFKITIIQYTIITPRTRTMCPRHAGWVSKKGLIHHGKNVGLSSGQKSKPPPPPPSPTHLRLNISWFSSRLRIPLLVP